MKVKIVSMMYTSPRIEIIGETAEETAILSEYWKRGKLTTGCGDSISYGGGGTSFAIALPDYKEEEQNNDKR